MLSEAKFKTLRLFYRRLKKETSSLYLGLFPSKNPSSSPLKGLLRNFARP